MKTTNLFFVCLLAISCQPTVSEFLDQCMTPAEYMLSMEKITEEVSSTLDELKITHWLDGGTLLGAYRFGSHMPYDDDVDFGLMREDFDQHHAKLEQKLLEQGYKLSKNTDNIYQIHNIKNTNSSHLDLFLFEPMHHKKNHLRLSSQTWHERSEHAGYGAGFPQNIIFHPDGSLQKINLLGKTYNAPVDLVAYCKRYYREPDILTNFMITKNHTSIDVCSQRVLIPDIRKDPVSLNKMFNHLEKVYAGRFQRSDSRLAQ